MSQGAAHETNSRLMDDAEILASGGEIGIPVCPTGAPGASDGGQVTRCSVGSGKMMRYRPRYGHEVRWWFFSLSVLSPRTSVVPPLPWRMLPASMRVI